MHTIRKFLTVNSLQKIRKYSLRLPIAIKIPSTPKYAWLRGLPNVKSFGTIASSCVCMIRSNSFLFLKFDNIAPNLVPEL